MSHPAFLIYQDDFSLEYGAEVMNQEDITKSLILPRDVKKFQALARKCIDFARSINGKIKIYDINHSLANVIIESETCYLTGAHAEFLKELLEKSDGVLVIPFVETKVRIIVYFACDNKSASLRLDCDWFENT